MKRLVPLAAVALLVGCGATPAAPPRTVVRLAGTRFVESLAHEYAQALPGITFQTISVGSPIASVDAVQRGDADLAIAYADAAYGAYIDEGTHAAPRARDGSPPHSLRAIATLQVTPLLLLARRASGIHSVGDLRGRVVRLTVPTPADRRFAPGWSVPPGFVHASDSRVRVTSISELLLLAFGVNPAELRWRPIGPQADALTALHEGTLDAMFMTVYDSDVLHALPNDVRLVPFEGPALDRLRSEYSFLRPITVPSGTYPGQLEALHTVGVDLILICRSELQEGLVYELTRAQLSALPHVWAAVATQPPPDLERASATPIPLHEGAARFYREWELFH
jgi:TRAP-type uncharacterized transport system substrate-binding protein